MCVYLLHMFTDDRHQLSKTCDSLTNFTITRDELLAQDEAAVDSTTVTPPSKKPKHDTNRKMKGIEKKKLEMAKVEAARARAKEIFASRAKSAEQLKLLEQQQLIEELQKKIQCKHPLCMHVHTE